MIWKEGHKAKIDVSTGNEGLHAVNIEFIRDDGHEGIFFVKARIDVDEHVGTADRSHANGKGPFIAARKVADFGIGPAFGAEDLPRAFKIDFASPGGNHFRFGAAKEGYPELPL